MNHLVAVQRPVRAGVDESGVAEADGCRDAVVDLVMGGAVREWCTCGRRHGGGGGGEAEKTEQDQKEEQEEQVEQEEEQDDEEQEQEEQEDQEQ